MVLKVLSSKVKVTEMFSGVVEDHLYLFQSSGNWTHDIHKIRQIKRDR